MTCTNRISEGAAPSGSDKLPLGGLLALSMAAFITILTEALPAGLLPQISAGLMVSEAEAGQLVSVYALGSLTAAIPLMLLTQGVRRRPLLLTAILGFLASNSVTALSDSYALTMVARFIAGVSAGLLWALIAGYATRMAPPHRKGRAIAIAMAGTPLALSLGVPLGTFMGGALGWRACFALMSILTGLLIIWILAVVPDFSGQPARTRQSLRHVFRRPGIAAILFVMFAFVLGHNILYTYIAPLLAQARMATRIDVVLLVFGIASLVSIWIVGLFIDGRLRQLTLASILLFACAAAILWWMKDNASMIYISAAIWGLSFGGCATLFQTASSDAAGPAADLAQSVLVTVWNAAIAGGGVVGGLLINSIGVSSFAPVVLVLITLSYIVTLLSYRSGFPSERFTHMRQSES
ncbi:Predicted arabinose efflux permease, MFS family [Cohaesibacter sp. ES.047]|uniref:MFS transporter n=1 Tax=Cohaesibacter sp. ES.047 TaxID=1798205 RepID=UPI000BC0E3E3|nr:MFS transporter [Cohaesibacter sp. ES.047]SNY93133.1 Predicted arabinose efflux permease, MFS family [Cohaesibacter sp. ES.047]